MTKKRVAIFASGSGTNMENLARRAQADELDCDVALVVCDQPNALALKRAEKLGLKTFVIERKSFSSKTEFDRAISERLKQENIDAIFLAGYMRILTSEFVRQWHCKIINIHPSLLPKYPGTHSIRDAFEAKETETGVTVHFVDEGVDTGPVILQCPVPIYEEDSLEVLEARIHATEYQLYPEAVKFFLAGKLKVKDHQVEIES